MTEPRVLVVRFSAIGDCVMTAWPVTSIRRKYPNARITWAVAPYCIPVLDTNRLVNHLSVFPRSKWKKHRWKPSTWAEQVRTYLGLRRQTFDVGIDFQGHSKTALCLRLAAPKLRIAAHATDPVARLLTRPVEMPAEVQHVVDQSYFALAAWEEFDPVDFPMMPELRGERAEVRAAHFDGRPVCSIQTGASVHDNLYPAEMWSHVAELMKAQGYQVIAMGAPGEPKLVGCEHKNLVGQLDLPRAMALVAESTVHLVGDTGTSHIAAGYGVPVVAVFGPAHLPRSRPYSKNSVALQRGLKTTNIGPDEVVAAALGLVASI